jgi:hypothetical protein
MIQFNTRVEIVVQRLECLVVAQEVEGSNPSGLPLTGPVPCGTGPIIFWGW